MRAFRWISQNLGEILCPSDSKLCMWKIEVPRGIFLKLQLEFIQLEHLAIHKFFDTTGRRKDVLNIC